jgi:DNA-binding transcriptional LysR family regulator
MQLEQLVAFDRVAREGSFSRAALALGLGQPAVSSRILALEDAVGGALFLRGRAIRLTALGESFLPYARQRALARTNRPFRDARRAFGAKRPQPGVPP